MGVALDGNCCFSGIPQLTERFFFFLYSPIEVHLLPPPPQFPFGSRRPRRRMWLRQYYSEHSRCSIHRRIYRHDSWQLLLIPSYTHQFLSLLVYVVMQLYVSFCSEMHAAPRYYAQDRKRYDLFGNGSPGNEEFRKAWAEDVGEDDCLWTGSDEDEDDRMDDSSLKKEMKKLKKKAKENADLIDADDSDELRSLCSESDEEINLWSGTEDDDDDDIPTDPHPNERSDPYIDKLFEFEEMPQYRTIAELLKAENEPPELSPGKQARKLAVENALKKLKKGPDGRYINVWEVMSDIDILIGAFENIVSGPEYAELREGGPKKLNMQFFMDIQARMRDPNFKFSPELKLKPKSKLVSRKKWQKAQTRRRKAERR